MNKRISRFIEEHPEYFARARHHMGWREGLHPLVEDYSRAVAPEEFERVEKRARELWESERQRLIVERTALTKELEVLRKERAAMAGCLAAMERLMRDEKKPLKVPDSLRPPDHSRFGRVATPVFFDLMGAAFIYMGLLVESRATAGYIALGILSVIAGFVLPHAAFRRRIVDRELKAAVSSSSSPQRIRLIKLQHRILREKLSLLSGRIRRWEHRLENNEQRFHEPYV